MLKELGRKQGGGSPLPWPRWFIRSAGGILALAGASRVLEGLQTTQVLDLQDPVSGVPFRYLLLLIGLMELFVCWLCLFTNKRALSLALVGWLAVNWAVYRMALWNMGWPHPWVLVGNLAELLKVSPALADCVVLGAALYLLAGSAILLLLTKRKPAALPAPMEYFKMHCPSCGGKTAFSARWAGQTIACPHCGSPLSLERSALKEGVTKGFAKG
jgi:DNA-directed RNA polymerase subunit RPC12/RpoP